jgi:hypothetical protein
VMSVRASRHVRPHAVRLVQVDGGVSWVSLEELQIRWRCGRHAAADAADAEEALSVLDADAVAVAVADAVAAVADADDCKETCVDNSLLLLHQSVVSVLVVFIHWSTRSFAVQNPSDPSLLRRNVPPTHQTQRSVFGAWIRMLENAKAAMMGSVKRGQREWEPSALGGQLEARPAPMDL